MGDFVVVANWNGMHKKRNKNSMCQYLYTRWFLSKRTDRSPRRSITFHIFEMSEHPLMNFHYCKPFRF